MIKVLAAFGLVLCLLTGCFGDEPQTPNSVKLKFKISDSSYKKSTPQHSSKNRLRSGPPATYDQFSCYMLNVFGGGISPSLGEEPLTEDIRPGCFGLGTVSKLVSLSTLQNQGIEIEVEAGPNRIIEFIGVEAAGGDCTEGSSLRDLFEENRPTMFVIGETETDLFEDSAVTIVNSYEGTSAEDIVAECPDANEFVLFPVKTHIGTVLNNGGYADFNSTDNLNSSTYPALNQVSAGVLSPIMPQSLLIGRGPLGAGSSEHFGRVDFLFDVKHIDLSEFSGLEVSGDMAGGYALYNAATGRCDKDFTEGDFTVQIYHDSLVDWAFVDSDTEEVEVSEVMTGIPSDYKMTYTVGGVTGRFFHLSVRSDVAVTNSSKCSAVKVVQPRITLIP